MQGRHAGALLAAAALALAACDIPTDPPIIESQWFIPVAAESISVAEVLPPSVTVSGAQFGVAVPAASSSSVLGALCASCQAANGQVVPKPAFTGTVTSSVALPASVAQATIGSGTAIQVRIQHDLGFDPIRPGGVARGTVTLTFRSNGVVLATDLLDGNAMALPSGVPVTRAVTIPAGSRVASAVSVEAVIASPVGSPVLINTAAGVTVTGTPLAVTASEARVAVQAEPVSVAAFSFSVDGLSGDLVRRVRGATLELALANPLGVGGTFTGRFQDAGTDLFAPRTVQVGGGDETVSIALSEAEIQALLAAGAPSAAFTGTVSGTAAGGLVTVTPTQVIRVTPRIVLRTSVGD